MRKMIWIINGLLFSSVIVAGGTIFWYLPKQTISQDENRPLKTFPEANQNTIFSGKFEKEFEAYYDDHFPMRKTFLDLASQVNSFKGQQEQEIRVINLASSNTEESAEEEDIKEESNNEAVENGVKTETAVNTDVQTGTTIATTETAAESVATETVTQTPVNPSEVQQAVKNEEVFAEEPDANLSADFSKVKGVVIVNHRVLQVFAGSKRTLSPYTDMLNRYREVLPASVKMYAMLIPSGSDFYLPYQVNKGALKEKENIALFNQLLSPNITPVPAYDEVAKHKNEYIAFRTDHHWTGLGAYYAYVAFAKTAGFQPLALEQMTFVRKNKTFLGSLYNYTKDKELEKYPDTLEYYKVPHKSDVTIYRNPKDLSKGEKGALYLEQNNGYMLFIGGDYPLIKINTPSSPAGSILIAKDSFGNALIPYLTSHYQDIYVVDYRYFKNSIPQFMAKHQIQTLLYAHNTFAANSKASVKFGTLMLKNK